MGSRYDEGECVSESMCVAMFEKKDSPVTFCEPKPKKKHQIEAFERAGEEGAGAVGRWCVVGDFNHNGPTVLGKGSRVVEVSLIKWGGKEGSGMDK